MVKPPESSSIQISSRDIGSRDKQRPSIEDLKVEQIAKILYRKTPLSKKQVQQRIKRYGAMEAFEKSSESYNMNRWWTVLDE